MFVHTFGITFGVSYPKNNWSANQNKTAQLQLGSTYLKP